MGCGILCEEGVPAWAVGSYDDWIVKRMCLVPNGHGGLEVRMLQGADENEFVGYYGGAYELLDNDPYTHYGVPSHISDGSMVNGRVTSEWPLQRYLDDKAILSFADSCRKFHGVHNNTEATIKFLPGRIQCKGQADKHIRLPMFASCKLEEGMLARWDYDFKSLHHSLRHLLRR